MKTKYISAPYLLWMAIFIFAPLCLVVYFAFTDKRGNFTFENMSALSTYAPVFLRSIILAGVATVVCLIMAYPVSYFMSRMKANRQKVMMMVKNISTMDIVSLLDHIREMKEQNFDMEDVLDLLQLWYRDVLMYKVTKDMNLLIFKDEYKVINGMVQKVDYAGLEKILASIDTARTRLSANVNMELAMELLLLTMKNPL